VVSFTVDASGVVRAMEGAIRGIDDAMEEVAKRTAETAADEARPLSQRLGAEWPVEGAGMFWTLTAPEFFAHFLARGTAGHGPERATRLRFEAGGGVVFARYVSGIQGDAFDERAVQKVSAQVDAILAEALAKNGAL
jgi:hypothetical protein